MMLIVRSRCVIAVPRLAPRLDPGLRPRLSGLRHFVIVGDRLSGTSGFGCSIAERDHAADLRGQILNHVASQFLLFALVLDDQTFPIILVHVRSAHLLDLVQDEDEDFFGALVALGAVGGGVADVAAGDVCCAVDGEGDAVGHFLAPA